MKILIAMESHCVNNQMIANKVIHEFTHELAEMVQLTPSGDSTIVGIRENKDTPCHKTWRLKYKENYNVLIPKKKEDKEENSEEEYEEVIKYVVFDPNDKSFDSVPSGNASAHFEAPEYGGVRE